jgi:hypothetical protein
MAKLFGNSIDMNNFQILNFVVHSSISAPSIPVSALRRRNAIGTSDTLQMLSQIQEVFGSYDSLAPLPPIMPCLLPLQRQQACPSDIPAICSPIRSISTQSNTD